MGKMLLTVLLTGNLQKSYTVFQDLPLQHRSTEFYKIFTFHNNPYKYFVLKQ